MPLTPYFVGLLQRAPESRQPIKAILELPLEQTGNGIESAFLRSLNQIPQVAVSSTAFNFVTVTTSVEALRALEGISTRIHYNAPRGIITAPFINDPVYGRFSLSEVTIPFNRQEMVVRNIRGAPRSLLAGPASFLAQFGVKTPKFGAEPAAIIIPTGVTRKLMHPPEDSLLRETKVAVLDTGLTIPHPQFNPLRGVVPVIRSTTGELPLDGLGHGQWCTCAAFGWPAETSYGLCQGVASVAGSNLLHVKCLTNVGMGTTETVLLAMQQALDWGAKVISMSLGGPLQGSVTEDPECQIIERFRNEAIFVVAAGNDGPTTWTIGSPGASPYAITVGAYSTHYEGTAIFSSRGPSAPYYRDNTPAWTADLRKYGAALQKPDCMAPGGGPVEQGDRVDQIYSGVTGWTNGMTDLNPFDVYDAMRGTSMATPHVAGLIALAYEGGAIRTAQDVMRKLAETKDGISLSTGAGRATASGAINSKSIHAGYGFLTFERLVDS